MSTTKPFHNILTSFDKDLCVGRSHKKFQELLEDQRQFLDELLTYDWNDYLSKDWDKKEAGKLVGSSS